MKLPLNPAEIWDIEKNLGQQKTAPVHVAVFLDPLLPSDLVDDLTVAFVPHSPHGRSTVDVLTPDQEYHLVDSVDVVVIVLESMRQSDPYLVTALAITARAREAGRSVAVMCRDQSASSSAIAATFDLSILDVVVASDAVQMLDQLAGWFASTQQSLKLAFAANFTWMRRHIAKEAITNTAMQNGAVGAVIFIPGADLPVMTLNQAKMVLQIAAAYGQPMTMERVRELAAVIGGGFALRAVARNVVGLVPGFGWAVKGVIGYTGTLAMGYAALEFFEDGGSAEGLATKLLEVRDKVAKKAQRDHERVPKAGRTPRVPRAQRARRPKALRAPEMDVTEELVSTEKGPSDYTRLT